jgi:hypothetical protein
MVRTNKIKCGRERGMFGRSYWKGYQIPLDQCHRAHCQNSASLNQKSNKKEIMEQKKKMESIYWRKESVRKKKECRHFSAWQTERICNAPVLFSWK